MRSFNRWFAHGISNLDTSLASGHSAEHLITFVTCCKDKAVFIKSATVLWFFSLVTEIFKIKNNE